MWEDHLQEGEGLMLYKDGSKYTGSWKSNKREGLGRIIFENSTGYEGFWKDDNICKITRNISFQKEDRIITTINNNTNHSFVSSRANRKTDNISSNSQTFMLGFWLMMVLFK